MTKTAKPQKKKFAKEVCKIGATHSHISRFALFLIALISLRCGTTTSVTENFSSEELISALERTAPRIHTFQGKGTIAITAPEESFSASFDVAIKNSDSLVVHLHGLFFISIGALLISHNAFQFYNALENKLLIGSLDHASFENIFHISGNFETIAGMFCGTISPPHRSDDFFIESRENGNVIFSQQENGTKFLYTYSPEDAQVVQCITSSTDNAQIISRRKISMFRSIANTKLPFSIMTEFPAQHRSIAIEYSHITLNKPVQFVFTVPKNVEIIKR